MSHPFGDLLTQYRARNHGLSQAKLAEAVGYDPAIIGKMCKGGKELTGPSGRDRVIQIIGALHDFGVLSTLDEANALLGAADMPPLYDGLPVEAKFIQLLRKSDAPLIIPQAARGLPVKRTNLPAQLTSFVGHEQDVAAVRELLRRTDIHEITLIGSPGVGKTRLALQVASEAKEDFADGAWFVALAPITDPHAVLVAILHALHVRDEPGLSAIEVLQRHLREREALLVLDNLEQVLDVAPLIADMLSAAPKVKVLATSPEEIREQVGRLVVFCGFGRLSGA